MVFNLCNCIWVFLKSKGEKKNRRHYLLTDPHIFTWFQGCTGIWSLSTSNNILEKVWIIFNVFQSVSTNSRPTLFFAQEWGVLVPSSYTLFVARFSCKIRLNVSLSKFYISPIALMLRQPYSRIIIATFWTFSSVYFLMKARPGRGSSWMSSLLSNNLLNHSKTE